MRQHSGNVLHHRYFRPEVIYGAQKVLVEMIPGARVRRPASRRIQRPDLSASHTAPALTRRAANDRVEFVREIELAQLRFKPFGSELRQIPEKGYGSKMAEIGLEGLNRDGVMIDGDRRLATGPMEPETEAAGPVEQIQSLRLLQLRHIFVCDGQAPSSLEPES